jgi:hypothetical protein
MKVVITQSMLFPWVGLLEQIREADVLVHYDDVQFSKGHLTNRIQVKTPSGRSWMTVPMKELHLGQAIDEARIQPTSAWRDRHLALLRESFRKAPHAADALDLAATVYSQDHATIGALARASMLALARYFGLLEGTRLVDVRSLGIGGASSQRVLDVVAAVGGTVYITGHGARNYLVHEDFEGRGVDVRYMHYSMSPYPQAWGEFTPFVTGLDLVANCGRDGARVIASSSVHWRSFVARSA